MVGEGLSAKKSLFFKKMFEDVNIYYKNFNLLFLYYYLKKIFYKIGKLLFQKKLNNRILKSELSRLKKLKY